MEQFRSYLFPKILSAQFLVLFFP